MGKPSVHPSGNVPRSLGMLVGSMAIFGSIGIFRRLIPLSSGLIAFFRGLVGAGCILLWQRIRKKPLSGTIHRRTFWLLTLTGGLIGFNWILLFEAYRYTTVSIATLCYYMQPIFVVVLSALLLRERLTLRKILCSVAALAGMVLVSGVTESGLSGGNALGIAMGLGAAALYAAVVLLNKHLPGIDPYEKTAVQLGAAAVALIPYLLLTHPLTDCRWSLSAVGLLLLVCIVHTGIAYVLYFGSMDGLKTQTVALFSYVDPVVALLLSAAVLGERLSPMGLLGAGMLLGAALICEWTG